MDVNASAILTGRLYVIDDEPAVAQAIAQTGQAMGLDALSFHSPSEFLAAFRPTAPCCIVLDLKMPEMTGIELLKRLADQYYVPPVIMVSGHGTIQSAVKSMQLGAITFLEKPFSYDELRRQISAAFKLAVKNWELIKNRMRAARLLASLKPREVEMLELIMAGQSNKQMAPALGMSIRGVEDRRARIMQKLEVESVAELCQLVYLARSPQREPRQGP